MQMDSPALLEVCKQHRLYRTPSLNDKLYANFKGFTALGGLEPYTGLRALFLEGNALASTDGLPPLPELRCLFLQQNVLTAISPAVAALPQLDTLNLTGNVLTDLNGLAGCSHLHTLLAADNNLGPSAQSVAALASCQALESVDLQSNKLEEGPALLEQLSQLPRLKCLYLRGNPLVSEMRSYRKTVIAALPGLTYLDDRPVFEMERLCAEAWAEGGLDAERDARAAFLARQGEQERRRVEALREIREAGWKKRREALGLSPDGGDPDLEGLPMDWQPEDGPGQEEEPPELRAARERLAAFTAAKQGKQEGEQLPDLTESDAQALAEDRRANQAARVSSASLDSTRGAGTPPQAEGCCTSNAATTTTTSGSGGSPVPANFAGQMAQVPEAAVTVTVLDGSCVTEAAHPPGTADSMDSGNSGDGGSAQQECEAGAAPNCASERRASVAGFYSDSEDDCLAALD